MKSSLYDRVFQRELGHRPHNVSHKGLYGASEWIDELDIVNELGGHTGCVNALSWSKSGRLLASGSDDTFLNIYSYQPDSSTSPFALTTSIDTGHSANIFSVKFMPHSNDQILLTSAGDSEVRIFDVEYSFKNGSTTASTDAFSTTRSRRMARFFTGARYLSHHDTNSRVYRSHSDRVKRIVTESSPYLFLTCSEDGEVRQWDLRQPSSAYPAPRGGQGFMAYRPGVHHDDSNIPAPLISYKRYHLDLNTISCSASQPHYIALGGAHLHCFLHDRRMIGRDLLAEKGHINGLTPSAGTAEDEIMSQATRCVRRFAPKGQSRMKPQDNGHITSCKISDARPNEIVVSWSGDYIYSFDLIRSPDARERNVDGVKTINSTRKRKREKISSATSIASGNRRSQSYLRSDETPGEGLEMPFQVRYGNGESENIPIPVTAESNEDMAEDIIERARVSVLTEAQKLSLEIAKGLVKMRKALFSLEASVREISQAQRHYDLSSYQPSFTKALSHASVCLEQMDEVNRSWSYPMNPSPDVVIMQQTLRRNREAARRFIQASGTLALTLGARGIEESRMTSFGRIVPAPSEDGIIDWESQFGYDFLKAILLWLGSGRQSLLEGFKLGQNSPRNLARFPVPEAEGDQGIEHYLVPYLRELASSSPIVDVDASRFEHDESRIIFPTQHAAVAAFAKAVQLPLEELEAAAAVEDSDERVVRALNRRAAVKFWGVRVGRGLLMSLGEGINFEFVNRAFGGLRTFLKEDDEDDDERERLQEDIDPGDDTDEIEEVRLVTNRVNRRASNSDGIRGTAYSHRVNETSEASQDEFEDFDMSDERTSLELGYTDDDEDNDMNDDENGDSDEDEHETDDPVFGFLNRGGLASRRDRGDVDSDVPCGSHEMVYSGHCNIKTVKDVNYYGLDDEYVVSGCDSGNVFIWDRKTAKLVNLLEGDGETVNIVQGHPYEPTLAVSGLDNTIKIFSSDRRAQYDARHGVNILNPDHPSNMFGARPRHTAGGSQVFGLRSCKRIKNSYQIMSQNDIERQGGLTDAFITRSMLTRLAATLGQRHTLGTENPAGVEIGEGATLVLDENCTVM